MPFPDSVLPARLRRGLYWSLDGPEVSFARRLFHAAGIYGVLVLLPMYFLEDRIGRDFPPPVTHPEVYYGFVGVALAWQVMYLLIGRDPVRYRPVMLVGGGGKASFGVAVIVLYLLGRTPAFTVFTALPDLALSILFVVAYRRTPAS